eukprot:1157346-Pelagomonas_calceolata.AAC.16
MKDPVHWSISCVARARVQNAFSVQEHSFLEYSVRVSLLYSPTITSLGVSIPSAPACLFTFNQAKDSLHTSAHTLLNPGHCILQRGTAALRVARKVHAGLGQGASSAWGHGQLPAAGFSASSHTFQSNPQAPPSWIIFPGSPL